MSEVKANAAPSKSFAARTLAAGFVTAAALATTPAMASFFQQSGAPWTAVLAYSLLVMASQIAALSMVWTIGEPLSQQAREGIGILCILIVPTVALYIAITGLEPTAVAWMVCIILVAPLFGFGNAAMNRGEHPTGFRKMAWSIIGALTLVAWLSVLGRYYPSLPQNLADLLTGTKADIASVRSYQAPSPPAIPPLSVAVQAGDLEEVRRLLAEGADPNETSEESLGLLALRNGHSEIAAELVAAGLSVTEGLPDGNTLLHLAIENGDDELADAILQRRVTPDTANDDQQHPADLAARQGNHDLLLTMLQQGFELYDELAKSSAVQLAFFQPDARLAKLLFKAQIPVHCSGANPLRLAIEAQNLELVELFLQRAKHACECSSCVSETSLQLAIENGDLPIITAVFQATLEPDAKSLKLAEGLPEVKQLLESRQPLKTPQHFIMESVLKGDFQEVESNARLVSLGDRVNGLGETLLHLAAEQEDPRMLQTLLKSDAQVDIADDRGRTALYNAIAAGRTQAVKLLLDAGASLTPRQGSSQLSPLEFARARGAAAKMITLLNRV